MRELRETNLEPLMMAHQKLNAEIRGLRKAWQVPVLDHLCRVKLGHLIQRHSLAIKRISDELERRASEHFPVYFNEYIYKILNQNN